MKDAGNVEYRKDLQRVFDNYIAKQFGDYELSQITVLDVTSFLEKLKRELSVSRAKFIKNVFNLILDFAADQGDIKFNPFQSRSVKKIKFTKATKKSGKAYTSEEVRLMLEHSNGWFKVFLDILFKTGARTGEAMVLKWSDIDLEKGIMHIKRTMHKGVIYEKAIIENEDDDSNKNHNRKVFLMESTLELLKQYHQVRPHDEWLFVNRYKKPYSEPKNISVYYFKPLLKELGIEYRTIYATRSTYISLMLNSGVSLEQVQANVGHKPGSKVTQAHYHDEDNVDLEKKKTQAQKLEDAFNDTVNNSGKKSVGTDQLKDMSDEELEDILQEELSDETCK
jgi:integrase